MPKKNLPMQGDTSVCICGKPIHMNWRSVWVHDDYLETYNDHDAVARVYPAWPFR